MTVLEAIIQGIIQGLSEFLPISSSGHLALYQHLIGKSGSEGLLFSVLLHMGTLVAVVIVFYKTILALIAECIYLIRDIFTGKFSLKNMNGNRRMLIMMILSSAMLVPLVIPFIPTSNGLTSLMEVMSPVTEGRYIWVVGVCFLFTAALLLVSSFILKKNAPRHTDATAGDAVAVGSAQALAALLPGISRSGSTVSAGLICGLKKDYIINYTFILSIPAILAANLVELKDALQAGESVETLPILVGVLFAMVFGVLAIKTITWLIKKNKYSVFGYYCAVVGVLVIIMSIVESSTGVASILELF